MYPPTVTRSLRFLRKKRTAVLSLALLTYMLAAPAGPATLASPSVNTDPVARADSATTSEDTSVTIDVLTNDSDPEGDPLTVTSATVEQTTPRHPVDRARDAGIFEITPSWGANVGDINNDNRPDVLVGRHNKVVSRLYVNDGGTFREVQSGTFGPEDRHDCPFVDVNQDGRMDIYCTLGARYGQRDKVNELWMQQSDGSFVNRASEYGVADPLGRGRFATFIDANHDQFPDLYVANDYPRQDEYKSVNRLFINQSGTSFRDATDFGLHKEVGGLCVQAADYNNDGWQDLLVCGNGSLRLYRNNEGKTFTDVTTSMGLNEWATGAVFVDLNGDGKLDLASVHLWNFQVRLQGSTGFGAPTAKRALVWGTDIEAGDADGDGDSDLFIVQGGVHVNNPDLLLLNAGSGTSLTPAPIPQTTEGRGDAVTAIDYDRNGTTDFIVLNGHFRYNWDFTSKVPGPVQLISYEKKTGSVVRNADGTVTYTPNPDFRGTDSFTYTVSDGQGGSAQATVTVTVGSVNDHPIAVTDYVNVTTNSSVRIDVLATDTDRDGNKLSVTGISTPPTRGRAIVNTDGTITYTPTTGYSGSDSFTYTASDGYSGTAQGVVSIRVIPAGGCTLSGAAETQIFYGKPNAGDVICGGGGNDFIYGLGGHDTLKGEDGNDVLLGGLGNDKLIGGLGTDICRDSSGTNSFSGCEKR